MSYRYFAVGDIHGCIEELVWTIAHIKRLEPNGCKVIFLGDYIDRGPDSLAVLNTIKDFQDSDNGYDVITLTGNHETMFVDAYNRLHNYYDDSVVKQLSNDGSLSSWVSWMKKLDWYHIEENNVFAHANYDPDNKSLSSFVWPRYKLGQDHFSVYFLTHGHTPVPSGPEGSDNRVNLDTGCVFGGPLTIGEYHYGKIGPQNFYQVTKKVVDLDHT